MYKILMLFMLLSSEFFFSGGRRSRMLSFMAGWDMAYSPDPANRPRRFLGMANVDGVVPGPGPSVPVEVEDEDIFLAVAALAVFLGCCE